MKGSRCMLLLSLPIAGGRSYEGPNSTNCKPQLKRCSCVSACVALFAGSALFGQQAQFQGSVPTGVASPTPLSLTLRDAIDRGLRTNLGLLLSGQASETARGERLRSLSALLPQVTGEVSENVEQIDLQTRGINFHLPGFSTPTDRRPVPLYRCARLRLL